MRSRFRPGFRPLLLFVGVALLLNAQYTWWIVYSLRESRAVLDLERSALAAAVERAAMEVEIRLLREVQRFTALPPGVIPSPRETFPEVEVVDGAMGGGWVRDGSRVAWAFPLARNRHALAWLDGEAPYRWLAEREAQLVLVERGTTTEDLPRVNLASPLDRLSVQGDRQTWNELLAKYRRRVVMVAVEGTLFLLAMGAAVVLLWTVFRKEHALELQHQNFVSAVTHELKTPMAGIRVALETVLSGRADDEERRRFLSNALVDVDRLTDLVGKVLEVTRFGQGAHRLQVEVGDLSELVEEEVSAVARRSAPTGMHIETAIEPRVHAPFDAEALAIVLSNLLENALKYSDAASAKVSVRLLLARGEAVVEVRDHGPGIRPEELEQIFEPFYRSTDQAVRRLPGSGIGLYVAREIMRAHGGRLTASSAGPGKGATFRMVLPGGSRRTDDESE